MAGKALGAVVPADVLYDQLKAALVQSGVLPRDAFEQIEKLNVTYGADGELARRIAGLAFFISRLPIEAGADIGVRATTAHLADLLVGDLTIDQGAFRDRVRRLIDRLVEAGDLVRIGEEVRIQTTEGRAWEADYRKYRGAYANDHAAIREKRDALVQAALDAAVRQVATAHGDAKVQRKLIPHRGDAAPGKDGRNIPLWIRQGWDVDIRTVRADARALGIEDGTIHCSWTSPPTMISR